MPVGLYLKIIWSLDNRTKNSGMVRIQGEKIVPEASELFFFFFLRDFFFNLLNILLDFPASSLHLVE